MEYLFNQWAQVKRKLSNKRILFFFDYDGTLTPIVKTPQQAVISGKVKELLRKLSRSPNYKLAIISGRALKDIKKIIGLRGIIYSGNHGLEIEGPKIEFKNRVSQSSRLIIRQINKDMVGKLSRIKGILIEDKLLTISVHYRMVGKKDIREFANIFNKIINPYITRGEIKINPGKKVYEIRPPIVWDKGKAVQWLLDIEKSFLKKKKFFPIYVGDDVTDENAFDAINNKGLTIYVGHPKESHAQYYLRDHNEVRKFLVRILEIIPL